MTATGGLRWWIAGLVFLATLINFLDRLTIAVLAPVITVQLGLTNLQFASISSWFLAAYTASQGLSGKLYDRIGSRRGFSASVLVWSAAAAAHAFARGFASLSSLRFLLGLGEGGNWPGGAKVIAEWFPVRERALGIAIMNSASALGSVVAPPVIVWIQLQFGWRATFLTTGALGFLWLALWRIFYYPPDAHPAITPAELTLIEGDRASMVSDKLPWRKLVRYRQTWAIVISRFFADPVWWFYITWLPLYLYNVRGFSLKQIGLWAWVPYVAAGAGSLIGGWGAGWLIARGWPVDTARKTVLLLAAILMLIGVATAFVGSPMLALALMAVVLFGFQAWISNVQTLPSDYFPENAVGSVAGLGGVGAGVGAILLTVLTGFVVDHFHTYAPILVGAGLLPVAATAALFALGGRIQPVLLYQHDRAEARDAKLSRS